MYIGRVSWDVILTKRTISSSKIIKIRGDLKQVIAKHTQSINGASIIKNKVYDVLDIRGYIEMPEHKVLIKTDGDSQWFWDENFYTLDEIVDLTLNNILE